MRHLLSKSLGVPRLIPEDPRMVGALGAAPSKEKEQRTSSAGIGLSWR